MRICIDGNCVRFARSFTLSFILILLGACTKKAPSLTEMTPEQLKERGRLIYMQNCLACHNQDISLDGPVGPAIKGASLELLRLKLLQGKYPDGYQAKRQTSVMPPMPQLEKEIPALHAYLQ